VGGDEVIQSICLIAVALSNVISAIYVVKFVRKSIPLIKNIDRSTRTLKTNVLLDRIDKQKLKKGVDTKPA